MVALFGTSLAHKALGHEPKDWEVQFWLFRYTDREGGNIMAWWGRLDDGKRAASLKLERMLYENVYVEVDVAPWTLGFTSPNAGSSGRPTGKPQTRFALSSSATPSSDQSPTTTSSVSGSGTTPRSSR